MRKGWQWLSLVMLVFLLSSPIASSAEENQRIPTTMTINPPEFTVASSGQSVVLTVVLEDIQGKGLPGKRIVWNFGPEPPHPMVEESTGIGTLNPSFGTTDSLGQMSITYTAPKASTQILVYISAHFAGDAAYQGSRALCEGVVLPPEREIGTHILLWIWILMTVFLVASIYWVSRWTSKKADGRKQERRLYQQKMEVYRRKLRQWEAEGYKVEELKMKWGFK